MMKKLIFLLFVILFIAGCTSQEIKDLKKIEIREYKGEKLSSIGDFRENSIKGPQYVSLENYSLQVTGLVENPKNYSYDEILNHQKYSKVVTLYCVEGWDATIYWEGVLVRDIIEEAKPMPEAKTVIFYAYDGYSTSFPIEYILEGNIIMAHKINNVILPVERGFPFQLVAESKWGYKWVKWITKIELSDDENYEGYWERRGYSNTGNLDEKYLK